MATANEIARLAAAITLIRPEWPTSSVQTILAKHGGRPIRDLAVAAIWVATDQDINGRHISNTPKRIDESGPWWTATAANDRSPTDRIAAYSRTMDDIRRDNATDDGPDKPRTRAVRSFDPAVTARGVALAKQLIDQARTEHLTNERSEAAK